MRKKDILSANWKKGQNCQPKKSFSSDALFYFVGKEKKGKCCPCGGREEAPFIGEGIIGGTFCPNT